MAVADAQNPARTDFLRAGFQNQSIQRSIHSAALVITASAGTLFVHPMLAAIWIVLCLMMSAKCLWDASCLQYCCQLLTHADHDALDALHACASTSPAARRWLERRQEERHVLRMYDVEIAEMMEEGEILATYR